MNKGFTLVELSIVLIIIGFLTGGILVAQSLIASAQTQAQIRQLAQFDIAHTSFIDRYKSLPGDSKLFQDNGDGDGIIESDKSANDTTMLPQGEEAFNYWKHLSDGNMLSLELNNDPLWDGSQLTVNPGVNAPETELSDTTGIILWQIPGFIPDFISRKFYGFYSSDSTAGGLTPLEAFSIDAKLDDGLGSYNFVEDINNTGRIRNFLPYREFSDTGLSMSLDTSGSYQCISNRGKYIIDNDEKVCNLLVELGSGSGFEN